MFQVIVHIWKKVSYLGIHDGMPEDLHKNVVLTNRYAFTWIFLIIPYIIIFLRYDTFVSYLLTGLIVTHIIVLFLNRHRLFNLTRLIESTVPQAIIFTIGVFYYTRPGLDRLSIYHMLNLAFLNIPFMIFSLREYKFIIISISISIFYYFSLEPINEVLKAEYSSIILTTKWFEAYNYIISAGLLILGFIYIRNISDQYQRQVSKLLAEANKTNQELVNQKNALTEQRDQIARQSLEIRFQKEKIENQHREALSQRDLIYSQNRSITESIYYARRIQQTILPPKSTLEAILKDYFIFFRPRDIVSGDFYWIDQIGDKVIIAVADCTGHGVPGGFLSMLGITMLSDAVGQSPELDPATILNQLRHLYLKSQRHQTEETKHTDGMDVSLCILDRGQMSLQYAGAYSSLLIFRNQSLIEIVGDRMPIGYHFKMKGNFSTKQLELLPGDKLYLFTDGITDQLGGNNPEVKKYSMKRYRQQLTEIGDKPMDQQRSLIEKSFDDWRNGYDQTDDILVLGFAV